MKKIIAIAAALLLAATMSAQNGKSIYRKYSDGEGVSAVYISSAMFRMMGRLPDMDLEGSKMNLGKIVKSLDGLYILDIENERLGDELKSEVNRFIDRGRYELMMEAKDNGETVRIYTAGDETMVTSFVMLTQEPRETTFICLDGQMRRDELEKAIAESSK